MTSPVGDVYLGMMDKALTSKAVLEALDSGAIGRFTAVTEV